LDSKGNPITRIKEPAISLDDLWELRKGIGEAIGDSTSNTARAQYNKLLGAISEDMETAMGQKNAAEFKAANDAFKKYSLKFDVLRQAYDKAMGTTSAGTEGFFSPQKYAVELKKLANDPMYKGNIKWSPSEIEHMTGLANILQVAKRGAQFLENPPTGNRWGQLLVAEGGLSAVAHAAGGGLPGMAVAGTTSVGLSLLTKYLTTNPRGIQMAIKASKMSPNSPALKALMVRAAKSAAASGPAAISKGKEDKFNAAN